MPSPKETPPADDGNKKAPEYSGSEPAKPDGESRALRILSRRLLEDLAVSHGASLHDGVNPERYHEDSEYRRWLDEEEERQRLADIDAPDRHAANKEAWNAEAIRTGKRKR